MEKPKHNSAAANDITVLQRMASASVGGLLTSLLVTPFDVVKNRLQAMPPPARRTVAPPAPLAPHVCDIPTSCSHFKVS